MTTLKQLPENSQLIYNLITDPYHDTNLPNQSFPDGRTNYSYARRRVGRYPIACPFSLSAGDSWNMHIFTTPLHEKHTFNIGTLSGGTITGATTLSQQDIGPINVVFQHIRAGSVLNQTFVALGTVASNVDNATPKRTVAFGYELHDITPPLYQSGAITQYRTNSISEPADLALRTQANTTPILGRVNHISTLPVSVDQANLLPNSRTWEVKEGVYAVCLPHYDNEFSSDLPRTILVRGTGPSALDVSFSQLLPGAVAAVSSYSPLHCAGSWITGLNAHTLFTLDWRQFLEIAPNPEDVSDMELASKTPEINSHFLKLYKRTVPLIPPGVPVGMNSAGDWFRRVVSIANTVLPHVVQFLPPKAQLIASPIAAAVKALNAKVNTVDQKLAAASKPVARLIQARANKKKLIKKSNVNITQRMSKKQ